MWSKAPQPWGGVQTHQPVLLHQDSYIDPEGDAWDHQLAPEEQGHQVQDLYTQEVNQTQAHHLQEDHDEDYIDDPGVEEDHQDYELTGHTLEAHQVYQGGGHATPSQVYRGAGQVMQGHQIYQGMGKAAQGHPGFHVAGQVTQGHVAPQGNQRQGEKQHLPVHLTPASSLVR